MASVQVGQHIQLSSDLHWGAPSESVHSEIIRGRSCINSVGVIYPQAQETALYRGWQFVFTQYPFHQRLTLQHGMGNRESSIVHGMDYFVYSGERLLLSDMLAYFCMSHNVSPVAERRRPRRRSRRSGNGLLTEGQPYQKTRTVH